MNYTGYSILDDDDDDDVDGVGLTSQNCGNPG
jgi:hypothetical protein